MDKNKALGDQLQGEAIKGTIEPEVKKEEPYKPFSGNHAIYIDPSGRMWDPVADREVTESEKRLLDGNR